MGPRGATPILAAAAALALLVAPSAHAASTTIGQSFTPTASCSADTTLQTSVETGTPYVVPAPGVITSWSFDDGSTPTPGLMLTVGRNAGGFNYTITGEAVAETQTAGDVNTYPTSIPVNPGDVIGIAQTASGFCAENTGAPGDVLAYDLAIVSPNMTATFSPSPGLRAPVAAQIVLQPGVSSVSPPAGSTAGGSFVTIGGHDFTGATAVRFGGRQVPFLVNSDTSITAAPFPASSGTVDVTVTTAGGTSPLSASDHFTFTAPSQCIVPKLKGKRLKAAKAALKKADCTLGKATPKGKKGKVKHQSPKSGTVLPAGASVNVKVG